MLYWLVIPASQKIVLDAELQVQSQIFPAPATEYDMVVVAHCGVVFMPVTVVEVANLVSGAPTESA